MLKKKGKKKVWKVKKLDHGDLTDLPENGRSTVLLGCVCIQSSAACYKSNESLEITRHNLFTLNLLIGSANFISCVLTQFES